MKGFEIKSILVPLDGSQTSFGGLEKAIYLAKQCNATITGLYVAFLPPNLAFETIDGLDSTVRQNFVKILVF